MMALPELDLNFSSPAALQDYLEFHPQDRQMIFWPDSPPFI